MQNQFFRYELRTTDVPAARRFYAEVFGPQFWGADLSASALYQYR
jgi:predicted enzyme related to lactoylglutathione lyase